MYEFDFNPNISLYYIPDQESACTLKRDNKKTGLITKIHTLMSDTKKIKGSQGFFPEAFADEQKFA